MADKAGDQMWFFYNPDGTAMSMKYRGLRYYYIKNLQGDVTGITDQNGNVIVNYEYNTWGKLLGITGNGGTALTEGSLADTISKLNPFRYRSYVYDDETRLYYLKSRYYDPQTGRFINADIYASTGQGFIGNNMFAYCLNRPVNCVDHSGEIVLVDDATCVLILLVIGAISLVATQTNGSSALAPEFSPSFPKFELPRIERRPDPPPEKKQNPAPLLRLLRARKTKQQLHIMK